MGEEINVKIIDGDDLIIVVDGKPTYHAETHKLSISAEKKERRTKDTGGKRYAIGDINWIITGGGLACIKDLASDEVLDSQELMELMLSKKEVTVITKNKLEGTKFKPYKGIGFITAFDYDSGTGADAKYNYTIEGGGLALATT